MPPPPMVPGKHNLDVNTWDVPNNIIPAPSPPLPENVGFSENNHNLSTAFVKTTQTGKNEFHTKPPTDINKEDNPVKYNFNFGRIRNLSSSKNWSTQANILIGRQDLCERDVETEEGQNNKNITFNNRRIKNEQINNNTDEINKYSDTFNCDTPNTEEDKSQQLSHAVLDKLRNKNNYNPLKIDLNKASVSRY